MKAIKILFLSVFLIFLVNTASAVVVYGEWNDNHAQSIEIEDGDSVDFSAFFGTIYPPMTISIKWYDSGNNLIHTFEDTIINQKSFAQTYTVNQGIYSMPDDFQVRIHGSDNFGEMSTILYLEVINYPPVITSTPITEVNEEGFYSYDVEATDPDNHVLTYSFSTAPKWLSINSNTGLITGTAPEVDANTDFSVSVVVSDGIDTDTQFYTLTVIWIPNPFLSQTLALVEDVKVEYNAVLYELDSAILKIYYKEFSSLDDYGLIETIEITTSPYNEIFDFYNLHQKTKGDYRFVIKDSDSDLSVTNEIPIPDYAPEVVPIPDEDFNEESLKVITLPVPTDINPEDNPVAYLSASSSKTTVDINGNILTLEGNRDETGAYTVELKFGEGVTGTAILEGEIYDLIDISGVLENNENDTGIQGVIRVYDSDQLPLEINQIYEGTPINVSLGKIETILNGTFSFQINEKASELSEIILQARIGTDETYEGYTGYVRTIELSGDDNSDILVRAVPYDGLNENGISIEDFRRHAQEVLTKEDNPPEDVNPWIFKWNFGEDLNSSSLFKEVIISKQNPNEPEAFAISQDAAEELEIRILNSSDIGSGFDGKINNTMQVIIEDSWIIEEPRDYGKIIIYPSVNSNSAITFDIDRDGYLDIAIIHLITTSNGDFSLTPRAPAHEIFHTTEMYGHTQIFNSTQSIMTAVAVPGVPITPRFADMKLAKAIYEDTYKHGVGMKNWLRLESILGLGFYGEIQITGTLSESPFEAEDDDEDFIGDHQNSNEDSIIDFDNTGSSNDVNANTPYDGTIHLQSNADKNNIMTSLSNIIRRVISFVSQKLRSVFSI